MTGTRPADTPGDPVPNGRAPFNEVSVLFPILTLYTAAYLGLMAAEFLLRGDFALPPGLMPVYIALTGAYAADKEIRRWAGAPEPPRKGSVFVYLWLLFYLLAFLLHAFRREFALPPELGKVVLQVLGIFFGSRASKAVWDARGQDVPPAELPVRGRQALDLVRARGRITTREVADALRVSAASAKRILADLAARGAVRREGDGRATCYVPASDPRIPVSPPASERPDLTRLDPIERADLTGCDPIRPESDPNAGEPR